MKWLSKTSVPTPMKYSIFNWGLVLTIQTNPLICPKIIAIKDTTDKEVMMFWSILISLPKGLFLTVALTKLIDFQG